MWNNDELDAITLPKEKLSRKNWHDLVYIPELNEARTSYQEHLDRKADRET